MSFTILSMILAGIIGIYIGFVIAKRFADRSAIAAEEKISTLQKMLISRSPNVKIWQFEHSDHWASRDRYTYEITREVYGNHEYLDPSGTWIKNKYEALQFPTEVLAIDFCMRNYYNVVV